LTLLHNNDVRGDGRVTPLREGDIQGDTGVTRAACVHSPLAAFACSCPLCRVDRGRGKLLRVYLTLLSGTTQRERRKCVSSCVSSRVTVYHTTLPPQLHGSPT